MKKIIPKYLLFFFCIIIAPSVFSPNFYPFVSKIVSCSRSDKNTGQPILSLEVQNNPELYIYPDDYISVESKIDQEICNNRVYLEKVFFISLSSFTLNRQQFK